MILPKVKTMDETGDMDHDVIRGLFENGVRNASALGIAYEKEREHRDTDLRFV